MNFFPAKNKLSIVRKPGQTLLVFDMWAPYTTDRGAGANHRTNVSGANAKHNDYAWNLNVEPHHGGGRDLTILYTDFHVGRVHLEKARWITPWKTPWKTPPRGKLSARTRGMAAGNSKSSVEYRENGNIFEKFPFFFIFFKND